MIFDTAFVCFYFAYSLCSEVIERVVWLSADPGESIMRLVLYVLNPVK